MRVASSKLSERQLELATCWTHYM